MTQERYLEESGREQKGLPVGDETRATARSAGTSVEDPPDTADQAEPDAVAAHEGELGAGTRRRPTGAEAQTEVER